MGSLGHGIVKSLWTLQWMVSVLRQSWNLETVWPNWGNFPHLTWNSFQTYGDTWNLENSCKIDIKTWYEWYWIVSIYEDRIWVLGNVLHDNAIRERNVLVSKDILHKYQKIVRDIFRVYNLCFALLCVV